MVILKITKCKFPTSRRRIDKVPDPGAPQTKPKRLKVCLDVSGSMYRFNGYDQRLVKSLEAALMTMTALDGKTDKVQVCDSKKFLLKKPKKLVHDYS